MTTSSSKSQDIKSETMPIIKKAALKQKDSGDRRSILSRFTLKDGNSFLLSDDHGDIRAAEDGFYTDDTRFISRFDLHLAGCRPSILGAAITQDNTMLIVHLTNRPLTTLGELALPHGVIHIERTRFLWGKQLYERIRITNYGEKKGELQLPLQFNFESDFVDIFEVRGRTRKSRGVHLPPQITQSSVRLGYQGLDTVIRTSTIEFSRAPAVITPNSAEVMIDLPQRWGTEELYVNIRNEDGKTEAPSANHFNDAAKGLTMSMQEKLKSGAQISTSERLFDQWIEKSRADLALLTTQLESGPYPYAGIPWFTTPFGRDGVITALETLWMNPQISAGVLKFLAATQAKHQCKFRDSQPGKVLHETRRGEMANVHEVPYGLYYGGVDTTPLFVLLAGEYEDVSGDATVVDQIWDALVAAVRWIERRMAESPTGFLDYQRGQDSGLVNQSWKDSNDSMFHDDGRFPKGPVAVVEVQGYAYAAFKSMSKLAQHRGFHDISQEWQSRAEDLRKRIEEKFWVPEMEYYAIALDGDGKACKIFSSDAGHLLFCGVPSEERGASVIKHLLSNRFRSGWGIRTLAEGEPHYNPMSYHNGSVWPHDTTICAAGIARYGGRTSVVQIISEIFEAAIHFHMRLPELYCGFQRVPEQGPVAYPVACLPQAWATGALFMLIQSVLGLKIDGRSKKVHIEQPMLPSGIEHLRVKDLSVGKVTIDVEWSRLRGQVFVVASRHEENGVQIMTHL
eukprot:TRINITY_DN7419_c0_g1_i1.p1 TRINITY_DN7419_c0_g1~~TRINITY_DN7419_c0_g1_i1.p1  ORF type:complete len:737 (-),score=95.56 TRINITY_DN7419_c0_g1_i1:84-2294(-)